MAAERIDVLAVMDANLHYQQDNDMRRDLREARAAVAELIEVSRALLAYRVGTYPVEGYLRDNDGSRAQIDALAAALARLGGAP